MAMSMRQRRGGNTISYETFRPNSEWIEEHMFMILRLNVLGFLENQIEVHYNESASLIRVSGERPILNNKRLRLNEQFLAPRDCNIREMKTQFDEGILRILIPKLYYISPKEDSKETLLQDASIEPVPPNGHEDTNNEQKKIEEKIEAVISEKSSEAENVREDKEDEVGEKCKESKTSAGPIGSKEKEMKESGVNLETKRADGDCEEKRVKIGVHNIKQNEEKQVLINVGIATLVIMAVGAQVYFQH